MMRTPISTQFKKKAKRVGVSEGNKFPRTSHYLCLTLYKQLKKLKKKKEKIGNRECSHVRYLLVCRVRTV